MVLRLAEPGGLRHQVVPLRDTCRSASGKPVMLDSSARPMAAHYRIGRSLFNQGGMAGCSVQDILHATGMEKGGLYRHFSSKQELAAECLKYSLALVFQARAGDAGHIPNAIDKLRYLVDRFVSTPSPLKGGCPLMNAAVDSDDGDPQLRRLSVEGLRAWKSGLLEILKDGIARGEVVRETDPVRVVNTVIAVLEGSLLISRLERTSNALEDARWYLHGLFDGLAPTGRRKS